MVQQSYLNGELHVDVHLFLQDINDQPPNPYQPVPNPRFGPKPKVFLLQFLFYLQYWD